MSNIGLQEWFRKLDRFVQNEICISIQDLPDMNYRDYYEDELSFEEVLELIKEENDISF